jgi:hypothetical protein
MQKRNPCTGPMALAYQKTYDVQRDFMHLKSMTAKRNKGPPARPPFPRESYLGLAFPLRLHRPPVAQASTASSCDQEVRC